MEFIYEENKEKVSDEALLICAINGTLRTKGVVKLVGGITDALTESILKKEMLSKGIKMEKSKDGLIFHIYVVAKYGYKIPNLAWDIQENVKNEIEFITGEKVKSVNIVVQKVKA